MSEEIERWKEGPLEFVATTEYDECPDISWMGEYVDQFEDYVFDRKEGWLITSAPEPEYPDDEGLSDDEWAAAEAEYEDAYDKWDAFPYEILAEVRSNYGWHEYRYWRPSQNHCPPGNPKNWALVENVLEHHRQNADKMRRFRIEIKEEPTHEEAARALDILYMCQDYERIVDLECGWWHFVGVVVTVYLNDAEVTHASLWGIESDAGDYIGEAVEELANECRSQLPASVQYHRDLAQKIEEAIT